MLDDRRLLQLTHKGRESAARELWRRFSPRLLMYARSIVGNAAGGAEDVVQSVFLAVLKQPRSVIRNVEEPGAWLLILTRRCALNFIRSARRDGARRQELGRTSRESVTIAFGETESLNRAVGDLPRRLREVVVLRHIAGLTFDQVAAALGANRNTTAARYREAMKRLRLVLDGPVLSGSTS